MSFDAQGFDASGFDVPVRNGSVTISWPSQGSGVGSISADTVIIITISGGEVR